MADGRDEKVWTIHAKQHEDYTEPYAQSDGLVQRQWLLQYVASGAKVVDFGCGSGLWRKSFNGYDYTGVDQNAAMIAVAKGRDAAMAEKFLQIQWDKLPFEDQSVDVIFSAAVLQHNRHPAKKTILTEFARVIKPGGYYMCTENTFREDNFHTSFPKSWDYTDTLDDGYTMTPPGWKKFVEPFGFERIHYQPPGEYLYKRV